MHACYITRLCIVLFCKYNAHIRILHASALQTNCKQSGHCSQSTETMVCWGLSCNGNCLAVTSIFVFFTCIRADHGNWNRGCNRNDNNDNGTRYDRNDNNDNGTTDISNRLLNINNRLVLTLQFLLPACISPLWDHIHQESWINIYLYPWISIFSTQFKDKSKY